MVIVAVFVSVGLGQFDDPRDEGLWDGIWGLASAIAVGDAGGGAFTAGFELAPNLAHGHTEKGGGLAGGDA